MNISKSLITLLFLLLLGCSNSSEPEQLDDLFRDYFLSNSFGRRTTSFEANEDIFFNYMFINNTGDSLDYGLTHSGPFVTFVVLLDTSRIGSTADGYAFLTDAPKGVLLPGDTLWARPSWLSNEYHDKLPAGTYYAVAFLHIWFKDHAWAGLRAIEFSVHK